MAGQRSGIGVVWVVVFLDLLGFGLVLPSLAYFVHLFPVPPVAVDLAARLGIEDASAIFVGLIQSSYSICQFFAAPLWGRVSDQRGRRPVLLGTMFGFAVAWTLFATADSIGVLLFARALAGTCGANISTAQAYVADVTPPEGRSRAMGMIGMAMGLGFVFGPAIGAALASDTMMAWAEARGLGVYGHPRLLVMGLASASLSAIAFLVAVFLLRESRVAGSDVSAVRRSLREVGSSPGLAILLLVNFIIIAGFSGLESMFSQFNLDHLKIAQSANGIVFTVIGISMALVQGGLLGRVTRVHGERRVLVIGLVALACCMVTFGLQRALNPGLSPLAWLLLLSALTGAAFSFSSPTLLAMIATCADPRERGGVMGLASSAATLGRVVGPSLGGLAYSGLGPEWPFLVGAVLVLGALVTFLRSPNPVPGVPANS